MIMTLSNMVPMRVLVAQEELQGELEQELERYGIQPEATGMSDQQYSDAMADLQQRREQMLAGKTPTERRRILAMRNTMMWHLNNVSAAATDAMLCSSAVLCCEVLVVLCCAPAHCQAGFVYEMSDMLTGDKPVVHMQLNKHRAVCNWILIRSCMVGRMQHLT